MRRLLLLFSVMALIGLGLPPLAHAAAPDDPNELGVYVGYLYGDDLTSLANTPELDDDISYGIEYVRMFTDNWGFMARLGFAPDTVTNVPGGDVDMDVTYLDLSATYQWNWDKVSLYVPFGLGYAEGSLDRPLTGFGPGVRIDDDGGITYHVGLGLLFPVGSSTDIRIDARYRNMDKLVDSFDDSLDTFEATVGVGWTF